VLRLHRKNTESMILKHKWLTSIHISFFEEKCLKYNKFYIFLKISEVCSFKTPLFWALWPTYLAKYNQKKYCGRGSPCFINSGFKNRCLRKLFMNMSQDGQCNADEQKSHWETKHVRKITWEFGRFTSHQRPPILCRLARHRSWAS